MQTRRFRQKPMQANDLQSVIGGLFPESLPAIAADFGDPRRQREGGDFDSLVADFGNEPALPLPVPVFEQLLTDGEFHVLAVPVRADGIADVRPRIPRS